MRAVRAAVAISATLALLPAASHAGEEDSPWPEGDAVPAHVRAIRIEMSDLEREVEMMALSAARYADWEACLTGVPVSEYGDPDGRRGYRYDERDGTGRSFKPALAIDRVSAPRREDYVFFDLERGEGCSSDAPVPGGTAEAASLRGGVDLSDLERRVRRLRRAVPRLLAASERFDAWESCVSWVPVTEYGDPDGGFGYLFRSRKAPSVGHRPALAIDRSDWDDPDYMFLAYVGGDRPGLSCQDEPGEAVDRAHVRSLRGGEPPERPGSIPARVENLEQDLDSLREDVDDLREPIAEFDLFDQCAYPIGVTEYGSPRGAFGYRYGRRGQTLRPALALDVRGFDRPQYQFLAFPGEEPPSIECNEDAGEESTDD